eukprot:jgi/Botrbrau1/20884/Bobra.0135s0015.1
MWHPRKGAVMRAIGHGVGEAETSKRKNYFAELGLGLYLHAKVSTDELARPCASLPIRIPCDLLSGHTYGACHPDHAGQIYYFLLSQLYSR